MLLAFQVLLMVIIVIFGLGMLAYGESKESKLNYTSVVLASIIAEVVCFIVV